jgi:hypothetical protein
MPDFIFAYHGGKTPTSPEEAARVMDEWTTWFEGLGKAVVIPGNPVGKSSTVFQEKVEDNGGANPLSGYTVVTANSLPLAIEMAKGCPMVKDGSGSVEVAEILEM